MATPIAALLQVVTALQPVAAAPSRLVVQGIRRDAGGAGRCARAPRGRAALERSGARGLRAELRQGGGARSAHGRVSPQRTQDWAEEVAQSLRGETLRVYVSDDLTGVEVGGALKNVMAIAAGASDGMGFGHNTRAALITRGLADRSSLRCAWAGPGTRA